YADGELRRIGAKVSAREEASGRPRPRLYRNRSRGFEGGREDHGGDGRKPGGKGGTQGRGHHPGGFGGRTGRAGGECGRGGRAGIERSRRRASIPGRVGERPAVQNPG